MFNLPNNPSAHRITNCAPPPPLPFKPSVGLIVLMEQSKGLLEEGGGVISLFKYLKYI